MATGPNHARHTKLTDDFLREVAATYEQNVSHNRPVVAVAERYGIPYNTATGWAAKARRRGFLAPTSMGRASGEPERAEYRAVRAAALRDAADALHNHRCEVQGIPGLVMPCDCTSDPVAWLRERADEIGA